MFTDRKDGGIHLGKALEKYKGQDVIVFGIPRGGVETAYYVAIHLQADFSLLFAKKLTHPANPELAIGALAEDGSIYINELMKPYVSDDFLEVAKQNKAKEIQEKIKRFRHGEPLPNINGRTVIIVDDGIATGATVFAAIRLCRSQGAKKIIVAAPIGAPESEAELGAEADEVLILDTPEFYHAVSQGYSVFFNLTDEEALSFLEKWENEYH